MKEAFKLVQTLNNETFLDNMYLDWVEPFTYLSDGNQCKISFLDIAIWDDDNDDREWINDGDEKEPLRDFIITETKKVLVDINKRISLI